MFKKALASILFSAVCVSAPFAQSQTTQPEATPVSKQPAPLPPRPLNLPKPVTYKLPNGLTVVMLEDHKVPFVTFQLGIRVGDVDDPKSKEGLAAITADMLTEGTKNRSSKQIAESIDSIGGAMKGSSDADFTIISGSALSEHKDQFFDILSDIVRNPTFPESELKLKKTNIIQALSVKRTDPDFLGSERFNKVVFGDHHYSIVSPTPESVAGLTKDQVGQFHADRYLPNASTLVVVGDFDAEKMKQLVASKFGDWTEGRIATTAQPSPPTIKGSRIYLIDRPGSVQSNVKIGNVGISRSDKDFFPAMVANQILGGSANSRLFLNIREAKGYTYGAYSGFAARKDPGEFTASAAVRTPVTAPSILEFLYELNRIRTIPVTKAELDTAKKYMVGNFQLGFESQGAVAGRLMEQKLYDLPDDYLSSYANKVLSVTEDDVRRVAHNRINYENLVITVVGDAKTVEPELSYFFPVDVYDATGKPRAATEKKRQPAFAGSEKL